MMNKLFALTLLLVQGAHGLEDFNRDLVVEWNTSAPTNYTEEDMMMMDSMAPTDTMMPMETEVMSMTRSGVDNADEMKDGGVEATDAEFEPVSSGTYVGTMVASLLGLPLLPFLA